MANLVQKDGRIYLAADLAPRKVAPDPYHYDYYDCDEWCDHQADLYSEENELNFSLLFDPLDAEPKVEDVWQMRQSAYTYGGSDNSTVRPGKNSRRPLIGNRGGKSRLGFNKVTVLTEVVVDDRRYRV